MIVPLQEEEPTPLEALRAEVQRATGMGMGSDRSASSAVEQVRSHPWPTLTLNLPGCWHAAPPYKC